MLISVKEYEKTINFVEESIKRFQLQSICFDGRQFKDFCLFAFKSLKVDEEESRK